MWPNIRQISEQNQRALQLSGLFLSQLKNGRAQYWNQHCPLAADKSWFHAVILSLVFKAWRSKKRFPLYFPIMLWPKSENWD